MPTGGCCRRRNGFVLLTWVLRVTRRAATGLVTLMVSQVTGRALGGPATPLVAVSGAVGGGATGDVGGEGAAGDVDGEGAAGDVMGGGDVDVGVAGGVPVGGAAGTVPT